MGGNWRYRRPICRSMQSLIQKTSIFSDTGLSKSSLNTARTSGGEEMLASWLLQPATIETVRQRQEAVTELRPSLDLREELTLLRSRCSSERSSERAFSLGQRTSYPFREAAAIDRTGARCGDFRFDCDVADSWACWLALSMLYLQRFSF